MGNKEKKVEITIKLTPSPRLIVTATPVLSEIEDIKVIVPYVLEISTGIQLVGEKELSFFENLPAGAVEIPDTWVALPQEHVDALRALHAYVMGELEVYEGLEDPE